MKNQKVLGVSIAYAAIIFQIIINIGFTPFLIKSLGTGEFGLYQTVNSFAANLSIMNFGVATIMSRSIVKFRIYKKKSELDNLLFWGTVITAILSIVMLVAGGALGIFIEPLYKSTLKPQENMKAKYMFSYLVVNMAVMVWNNLFSGISVGYEQFVFTNGLKLFRQVLRVAVMTVLLLLGKDAVAIVVADLFIAIVLLMFEMAFAFVKLKITIRYNHLDKVLLLNIFTFSMASMIQGITNQVNFNIDKVVLGAMVNTEKVAIYSVALLIMVTMVSILQVISGVYLPEATKFVVNDAGEENLARLIITPGRIQSIIGCGILLGFIVLGKNFLQLWVGKEFTEVWLSTVILLVPAMLAYVTSVANVILDAMLKKMARSIILIITALLNFIMTIILVKHYGYMGAAIGTAISIIIGNLIMLNLYYEKTIKVNMLKIYKNIFKGILSSSILAASCTLLFASFVGNTFMDFMLKTILFVFTYGACLMLFGLNNKEKQYVKKLIKKSINAARRLVHIIKRL